MGGDFPETVRALRKVEHCVLPSVLYSVEWFGEARVLRDERRYSEVTCNG